MKIIILALTAFVLAAAPFARAQRAQEEVPAPAPAPEATEPEKSESPAEPTEASSPAKTTAASTKSAPSAAVMPTKKSTAEATLKDIEDKWEASFMTHDPSVARAYLGNDYRGVSSKGKVMSKSNLLAEIKKDTDTYTSAKNGHVDVRVYDGHFAVVMGTSVEIGKSKDGKAFKRSFRWTDTWVDRDGQWQCVASQSMMLPK